METSPPSPSANISAQPSYQQDYSVNYQKLQPKFKDCTFDSDKKPEYLRTWLRLLSGIVRNIPHGKQIENFLDSYLQRRLNEATTRPSFLQEAGLQLSAPTAEAPSSAEGTNDQGSEAEVSINDPSEYPKAYYQLSSESQALDKALFHTLFTIVQGSYLDLITDLTGENARYTFAIIAMWRHGELGSSTRRIVAMNKMQELQYHGDASKWKLDFISKAREVYSSKLSIEHFIMHCAFKSFEGKNTQVQSMIAADINSDKVGPDMSLELLAGNYSAFLSTLSAGKNAGKINYTTDRDKCRYCGKLGHTEKECWKKARDHPDKEGATEESTPKGGRGRGKGKGGDRGRGRGGRGHDNSPPTDTEQQAPAGKDKEDKGKAVNNMQVSDKAVADLCQRLKSGEIKLQLCALESIDVGNRDSPHVGDLPSLLGGHPSDGAHLSRNDHSEPLNENPIFMARSEAKAADKIVLSLCDGMGCMALALRSQWKELGYTRYIAVEIDKDARAVGRTANPKDDIFPGIEHGLNGLHDIFSIQEDHISALPKDSIALLSFAGMCNDFSKLRLLPDRLDYKGPPRKPGVDPRKGLNGKYGITVRKCIEILGWVTKYHPNSKHFSENVEFSDMKEDWKEVCDALGKPYIINSQDHSYTCRKRAFWTNIPLPDDFKQGYEPKDSNDCLDPGRKMQKMPSRGRLCTLPLGASWKGDPEDPVASTNRPVLIIDENHDEPQHVRPEEAEQLHGMPRGTTAGDGISAITRLHCIGGGWDLNIINMFTKHLMPQTLEDQTRAYLASLAITSTSEQLDQGEKFYLLQQKSPQAFNGLVASLATDSIVQASKVVALTEHYRRNISTDDYSSTSIIDSGASRHVSPDVNILAPDDKVKLTSFTGKETWTSGNGYIPIDCHDDLTGNTFSIDIDNADHSTDTVSSLLSMCKLLRAGWKFDLELGSTFAFTPTGQRVELIVGTDDVLRIPHTLREGDHAKQLPTAIINAVKHTDEGVNPTFLHQLFNHANPDKIHRTLGATKGIKQPHSPLPGCHCTACAVANSRRKGLSHKQYTILNIGVEDQIDPDSIPEGDMTSPLIIKNDPSILMEDRIVNTTDTVDNSIFNRIEEGDDADHHFANATAQRSKLKHIDCRQERAKTLRNKNVYNTDAHQLNGSTSRSPGVSSERAIKSLTSVLPPALA